MIDLEAIAKLAASGFVVLVKPDGCIEVSAPSDGRSASAKRQAAYRERKASQSVTKHNKASQGVTSDARVTQPLPLSPSLPLPPQTPPSPAHPHAPAPAHPPAHACTREAVLPGLEPEAKPTKGRGTQAELEAYAVELGLPASDGTAMFDHWTANGWRNGQAASKCWRAGMRNWQRNGWMPSQKGAARLSGPRPPPERNAAYTPERAMSKLKPGETAQDF